ncbi:dTDP-4-dehydrorhamnose reductase [Sinomicrobium soli]|uniref:dTDP-4-dehydrorhamnose reductase n=1 Tax=Sinomicrobium sp. N-1-3-6 TaxID=2219864 RepID=UPI000DCBBD2D|nr:dTDP-4-dehydrorhamnose reductase [Sinomicrobium sp. N-1-3-6]RAV31004.1 dTDP-4-dehydrorhamnose reductase [Sinomicrobium sp. N-1-3-6]
MGKVWITGAGGQTGRALAARTAGKGAGFLFTSREALDLCHEKEITRFLSVHPVEAVINTAAYTAVDRAEEEPEEARKINAEAVGVLAYHARKRGIRLIHLSTDYVFDGTSRQPYRESDPVSPVNVYGQTKWEGEALMLQEAPRHSAIVRTAWLYGQGNNFVNKILQLARQRPEIEVVADQYGSPTRAADLAEVLLYMVPRLHQKEVKTYHYTNEGICTWFDFATAIVQWSGIPCEVNPVTSARFPTPARRPAYAVLSKEAIKNDLGITIPHWKDSLDDYLAAGARL